MPVTVYLHVCLKRIMSLYSPNYIQFRFSNVEGTDLNPVIVNTYSHSALRCDPVND